MSDPLPDREADVVVVGAGVLGCAIAHVLACQGRSVLLLERWLREPDRIVGELMQPGGMRSLRTLGLADCVEGIDAIPCFGYAVFYHGEAIVIDYPGVDATGQAANPWHGPEGRPKQGTTRSEGRSFHHGRFIVRLRDACTRHENIALVESEVKEPLLDGKTGRVLGVDALTVVDAASGEKRRQTFRAPLTIAADGYMSIFRKRFLPAAVPQVRSKFYALELRDCPLPHPGYGQVFITKVSPILVYQIGTRETRMLIDVPHNLPVASPAAGGVRGYIRNTVVPVLPEKMRPSVLEALEAGGGAIPKSMPNSYMPAQSQRVPGLLILGDAINMRHPLTGGGMTVALNDVVLLSQLLHPSQVPDFADTAAVARATDALYVKRKALTGNINVLAQALYSLFSADSRQLNALRNGCFEYFRRGITDGPAGLLGGLLHRPDMLTYHFFSVALVAIAVNARSWGVLGAPLALVDAALMLWTACVVFLPVMWTEMR